MAAPSYLKAGLNNVGSYQVSGYPWLTGSSVPGGNPNNGQQHIQFPYVTKAVTVISRSDNDIYVHFGSRANSNVITYGHYITLPSDGDSVTFTVRCKEIYISAANSGQTGSFELIADLTHIDASDMFTLTGSGIDDTPTG